MMQAVFAGENPILRLNALRTQTERDEQEGYKKKLVEAPAPVRSLPRATAADERRIADATEQIDRCSAMVAARVAYAAMWHRGGRWQPLKEERLALERRYPLDVPPTVLEGVDVWDAYVDTEKRLRHDTATPREDRAKEIERAGATVLRHLGTMRKNLRA